METKFKKGAAVIASPSRGEPFAARVIGRYDTARGVFITVRQAGTKRDVNMRPGLLRLA